MEYPVEGYCWTDRRKVLTPDETGIRALRLFGTASNVRAGHPLEPHFHKNCIEIVFLVKGFQIYEAENERFNLTGSDIFVAYPDELHSTGSFPESVSDIIWMQIDLSPHLPFFGLDDGRADALRAQLRGLPRIFTGSSTLHTALMQAFGALSGEQPDLFYGEQLFVCALLQMIRLARNLRPRPADGAAQAVQYIRDHLNEAILLEDVAAACGLSLSRFKVKFKEETGATPRDYINRLKVLQAKQLLRAGHSVTETALELGFSTPNYFSALFRKYTGEAPAVFRSRTSGA